MAIDATTSFYRAVARRYDAATNLNLSQNLVTRIRAYNRFVCWRAELGGQYRVTRDGRDLGPPPSRTVAILLVGLLSRGDGWNGRLEIAQLLYPESDSEVARRALRQALSRLRTWVGDDAINADSDRVRLADGWSYSLNLAGGIPAEPSRIAPGLEHCWLDAVRQQWRQPKTSMESPQEAFTSAVRAAAKLDRHEARAILISGHSVLPSLSAEQVHKLLILTRPKSRHDPLACEYLEMRGFAEMASCNLGLACVTLESAYKLALELGKDQDVPRIAAFAAFASLESGDLPGATTWISRLGESARYELLISNLAASNAWNRHRLSDALAIMKRTVKLADLQGRQQRVHFWSNYAMLAAEAGAVELSEEAELRCREVAIPAIDWFLYEGRHAASALRLVAQKEYREALAELKPGPRNLLGSHWHLCTVYFQEIIALAKVGLGDLTGARSAWGASVTSRIDGHGQLNPRLKAREHRILACS